MMTGPLIQQDVLTLPVGVLQTLHYGGSEVRLYRHINTQTLQVGKRVTLMGREDSLFVQEAALLRSIEHPNVVTVYDVVEPSAMDPALAVFEIMMPYYPLGSVLDAMVSGHRFSVCQARDITARALRGIDHLHGHHRIYHRDLKTANLFLTGDQDVVKVGDFGEATQSEADGTSSPLITPRYWTPPEAFTPGGRHTAASEVFLIHPGFLGDSQGVAPTSSVELCSA